MTLINILGKITGQSFIMPFYHAVADKIPVHLSNVLRIRDSRQFEKDLDFLLKHYTPVSVNDIYNSIFNNVELPQNSFFLSFDDGLREFLEVAYPIIKKKGIPVALFVNTAFIDNRNLFYRFKVSILIENLRNNKELVKLNCFDDVIFNNSKKNIKPETSLRSITYQNRFIIDELAKCMGIDFDEYLRKVKPYLTIEELLKLKSDGVHIGAHSMDHPLFYKLNRNEQINQVIVSCGVVKRIFKQQIKSFSFPFTDYGITQGFFNEMNEKGIVDLFFGTAGMKREKNRNHLQRIPVENYNAGLSNVILYQYLYYLLKVPFFKNTIKRTY